MTSSSTDEMSRNSNDFNDQSTEYTHEPSYYHKYNLSNSSRRRRKRTIFTANDIEHLKEAFIQNPKPNRTFLFPHSYVHLLCMYISRF